MKLKLYAILIAIIGLGASLAECNNFDSLLKNSPMIAALFYKGNPGTLLEPFVQASKTPRFRFSEIPFINVDIDKTGIDEVLDQFGIRNDELPMIVLFRDGQIVRDENNIVVGINGEVSAEELRDFIDDYFSDLIEGIIKYSKDNQSQFSIPEEQILYADYDSSYEPYTIYQPIYYEPSFTLSRPVWFDGYMRSSFYYPYVAGYRPVWSSNNRPPWYRQNRPDHWYSNRPNIPGRPERPGSKPDRPERPGLKPDRPERPSLKPDRPERPSLKPDRPERPSLKPDRPERPSLKPDRPERPSLKPDRPERPSLKPDRPERPSLKPDRPERPSLKPERPDRIDKTTKDRPSRRPALGQDKTPGRRPANIERQPRAHERSKKSLGGSSHERGAGRDKRSSVDSRRSQHRSVEGSRKTSSPSSKRQQSQRKKSRRR